MSCVTLSLVLTVECWQNKMAPFFSSWPFQVTRVTVSRIVSVNMCISEHQSQPKWNVEYFNSNINSFQPLYILSELWVKRDIYFLDCFVWIFLRALRCQNISHFRTRKIKLWKWLTLICLFLLTNMFLYYNKCGLFTQRCSVPVNIH